MKTIFISAFSGIEVKNLLRTGVAARLLADPEVQLVLVTTDEPERVAHYRKEFAHPRIIVAPVPRYRAAGADAFFRALSFLLLRTPTTYWRAGLVGRALRRPFHAFITRALHFVLGRKYAIRLARFLDRVLVCRNDYEDLFVKYSPNVIVCANLFDEKELHLLREAKRRGVPTVGYINSWDKVTARAVLRDLPDQFIVFNETIRGELVVHHAVPRKRIAVCGIPQYDFFFRPNAIAESAALYGQRIRTLRSREEFLRALGLGAGERLVCYAPMGARFSECDFDMIDVLCAFEKDGSMGGAKLFVRFPPNDAVDKTELVRRPNLRCYLPGIRFSAKRGADWDMSFEDMLLLHETLAYASAVVGYASSIAVDAALFGVPFVGVDFETRVVLDSRRAPTEYYKMHHFQKALATGSIALASSPSALADEIARALAHPEERAAARKCLVEMQCAFTDGRASERVAAVISRAARGL